MELKVETNVEVTLKMSSDDFKNMMAYFGSGISDIPMNKYDQECAMKIFNDMEKEWRRANGE